MSEKRTLTTGEIADYCGVHFRTVIRWVERGWLKAYQLPGRGDNRVEIPDFIAFLKAHKMPIPEVFQFLEDASEAISESSENRVLIVDDEVGMAHSIQRVLRHAGYETAVATDGFRAGHLLESFSPNLMTLDLQMPGLGGMDVLLYLKEKESLNQVKVLVISALDSDVLSQALACGADAVLEKPFENKALLGQVEALLSGELKKRDYALSNVY